MKKPPSKKLSRLMRVYVASPPKERPDALQRELNRIDREPQSNSNLPYFLRNLKVQ